MSTQKAIRRLEQAGFSIKADNGKLRIHPADRLTPEQRDWITAHKAELLALLTASNDAAGHPCHPCHPKTPQSENFANESGESGESVSPSSEIFVVYRAPGEIQSEPPHKMYERPLGDQVRCAECRHAYTRPGDEPGAWRSCTVGGAGGFGFALTFCEQWEIK